jgi:hypothetical protein
MPAWWYVVFEGTNLGIYTSWAECSQHGLKVKGNVHQKYRTFEEASAALEEHNSRRIPPPPPLYLTSLSGWSTNRTFDVCAVMWSDLIIYILYYEFHYIYVVSCCAVNLIIVIFIFLLKINCRGCSRLNRPYKWKQ